jgi:hypothetical protein
MLRTIRIRGDSYLKGKTKTISGLFKLPYCNLPFREGRYVIDEDRDLYVIRYIRFKNKKQFDLSMINNIISNKETDDVLITLKDIKLKSRVVTLTEFINDFDIVTPCITQRIIKLELGMQILMDDLVVHVDDTNIVEYNERYKSHEQIIFTEDKFLHDYNVFELSEGACSITYSLDDENKLIRIIQYQ